MGIDGRILPASATAAERGPPQAGWLSWTRGARSKRKEGPRGPAGQGIGQRGPVLAIHLRGRRAGLQCPAPIVPVHYRALKYRASGWYVMSAVVVCSGSSWNPSLSVTPMRPASRSLNNGAWSSRFGQAG